MRDQHIADGYSCGIGGLQRAMNLTQLPELQIARRSDAKILIERGAQCSLRYLGRRHQVAQQDVLSFVLVQHILAATDDLFARNAWPPLLLRLTAS